MKTPLRLAAAISAALLLTSCSSPAPSTDEHPAPSTSQTPEPAKVDTVKSVPFNTSGLLATNAAPAFADGEPGVISVVQIGPLEKPGLGAVLLFAFRNNTPDEISHVNFTTTARSDGSIVSTGSSQDTAPAVIQPGEVGLAYIYFDNGESIPDGSEYEFTSDSSPVDTSFYNTAP